MCVSTSRHNIIIIITSTSVGSFTLAAIKHPHQPAESLISDISVRLYIGFFSLFMLSPQHKHLLLCKSNQLPLQYLKALPWPVFIISPHYLNWLMGQSGPKLGAQIKIYLGESPPVKKADCSPAGIYWGEIILHFLMRSLWPEENSDSGFFCFEEDTLLWQQ